MVCSDVWIHAVEIVILVLAKSTRIGLLGWKILEWIFPIVEELIWSCQFGGGLFAAVAFVCEKNLTMQLICTKLCSGCSIV